MIDQLLMVPRSAAPASITRNFQMPFALIEPFPNPAKLVLVIVEVQVVNTVCQGLYVPVYGAPAVGI